MSSTDIQQALQSNNYVNISKAQEDISEVLRVYQGLHLLCDRFVFNNGSHKTLLSLTGTIPICYSGNNYNIPVVIWLLDTHPTNAPLVFVQPTSDMRIKVSMYVNRNGEVRLPYLHDWTGASSDLLGLIQVLTCIFSEQPPVYAVPPGTQSPVTPPPHYGTPYPLMSNMPTPHGAGLAANTGTLGSLTPSLVRSSLVSAVEENLRRRMEDQYLKLVILRGTGKQLQEGKVKLECMVKDLHTEKINLERNMELCKQECKKLENEIGRTKQIEDEKDIDSAIAPPTALHRQIVDHFVKDLAMEDTIYYLSDALRKEKMDVEQFLKNVRQISRKQFMERALINKCRQKAGLSS